MKLESMEQRVANTPVALLCDGCMKNDCCKWMDDMRAAVVGADKSCYGRPFKPSAWSCQLYLDGGSPVANESGVMTVMSNLIDSLAERS